jgi:LysR family transcriptional regulator for metE and metH
VPPLLRGQIDLALATGLRSNRRILVRPLFADELVAVVAPHHPWAGRKNVSPRDFEGQRLFIVPPPEDSDVVTDFLRPAGVKPAEVNELVLTEALVAMVQAGLGIGALPRWTVGPELKAGTLAAVRLGRGLRRRWGLATLRSHPRSAVIEDFAALIAQPGALEGVA